MSEYVRDVMTVAAACVHPDTPLREAARLMDAQGIGCVLVARDGLLTGLLTDRDITVRAVAGGADTLTLSCGAVCTAAPVTVGLDDTVATAERLMRRHAVRRLPVAEAGRPLGLVSLGDLVVDQDPESLLAELARAAYRA
ncbi:CBS domain-containing protein [Streptomyces sp. 549]|uniref:CBS domain-containing protein n=1 Tax=Streptomyces sp. 549 TaxID=3049076 RepID=UPI0024C25A2B|nr:CBS domain-containing protein [Streptomyces sp. 549]MDK1472122.1 CBS domain-containing protein [Streptomyces sp. 549]